ncbi:MAG: hypothetical protein IBX71_01945 [Candidatus Desulforudis sp.]|nr:hypothetical protein [Desulforudis sp.]
MGERIKTALEKALERVAGIEISPVEIDRENFRATGKSLAGRFFSERNFDLEAALADYTGEVRAQVVDGILESLIGNLHPPANEAVEETNRRAMDGILLLKEDRDTVRRIFSEMEYLFDYYRQAVKQAQLSLREAFQRRAAETQRMIEQQMGVRVQVNPETSPEFREEWLRALHRIDVQYEEFMNEHKARLAAVG